MKKPSRKAAVLKADKYFSLYIREIAKKEYGNCPFCRKEAIVHCFHFFSRSNYATRWDENNATGSCAGCKYRMEFAPYPFNKWYADQHGQIALDELNKKHHTIAKFSTQDLLDIADKYQKLYEELK